MTFPASQHLLDPAADHAVQFYESEDFLADAVADFLAGGLVLGQPTVALLSAGRIARIVYRIQARGVAGSVFTVAIPCDGPPGSTAD